MKGYAQVEACYIDSLGGMDEIRSYNAADTFTALNRFLYEQFRFSQRPPYLQRGEKVECPQFRE